jgi:hypothetical protein
VFDTCSKSFALLANIIFNFTSLSLLAPWEKLLLDMKPARHGHPPCKFKSLSLAFNLVLVAETEMARNGILTVMTRKCDTFGASRFTLSGVDSYHRFFAFLHYGFTGASWVLLSASFLLTGVQRK